MTDKRPFISLILLGGGLGKRMGKSFPKQFLALKGKPLMLHSFDAFLHFSFIDEMILVCPEEYRSLFSSDKKKQISFADPGEMRQESLARGMEKLFSGSTLTIIHDAVRPFIEEKALVELIQVAQEMGAATLGLPVTSTIKECTAEKEVVQTLQRDNLWEIQTPQAIKTPLLKEALSLAKKNHSLVTDDVSLVELMQQKVRVVMGYHHNIKITYPMDLFFAEQIYEQKEKKI